MRCRWRWWWWWLLEVNVLSAIHQLYQDRLTFWHLSKTNEWINEGKIEGKERCSSWHLVESILLCRSPTWYPLDHLSPFGEVMCANNRDYITKTSKDWLGYGTFWWGKACQLSDNIKKHWRTDVGMGTFGEVKCGNNETTSLRHWRTDVVMGTFGEVKLANYETTSQRQCSTLMPARRPMAENLDPGPKILGKLVINLARMADNILGIKHKCEASWPGWPMDQKVSVDHCKTLQDWRDYGTFWWGNVWQ